MVESKQWRIPAACVSPSQYRSDPPHCTCSGDMDTEDGDSDADGDFLDMPESLWYPSDLGSRSSSPLPPDCAPAWLIDGRLPTTSLEDVMAAMDGWMDGAPRKVCMH